MFETTNRTTRFLMLLVAFLLAVGLFESYYLIRMHHRLEGVEASVKTDGAAENVSANAQSKDKTFHLAPEAQTPGANGSQNNAPAPFDPNAWDPFKEMEEMHKQMDRIFDESFGHFNMSPKFGGLVQNLSFNPKVDITENDKEYVVHMDVPGTDKSKIKAEVEDRVLTISGVRDEEVSQPGSGKNLVKERRLGAFERSVTLPGPVKDEQLQMKYDNGVITITIPKDTAPKKHQILPMQ